MEKFKVGDKVNFLNSTGGGTVKKIIDTRMVEVTIEDGFDIPVLMSDLVLDFRSQPDKRQQIVDNTQKEIQQKQIIEEKEMDEARKSAFKYEQCFGKGNYFLEMQDHGIPEQTPVNQGILRLARETGLPLVVTNDAHYLRKEDAVMQDVLLCIQTGKTVDDENRM